jgi:hypothetical protein
VVSTVKILGLTKNERGGTTRLEDYLLDLERAVSHFHSRGTIAGPDIRLINATASQRDAPRFCSHCMTTAGLNRTAVRRGILHL